MECDVDRAFEIGKYDCSTLSTIVHPTMFPPFGFRFLHACQQCMGNGSVCVSLTFLFDKHFRFGRLNPEFVKVVAILFLFRSKDGG